MLSLFLKLTNYWQNRVNADTMHSEVSSKLINSLRVYCLSDTSDTSDT